MPRKNIPVPVPPGLKWCHQCARARSPAAFKPSRRTADGLQYACHECMKRRRRENAALRRYVAREAARMAARFYAPTGDAD